MRKNNPYNFVKNKLLGTHLEFRVQLFNILAIAGIVMGSMMGIIGYVTAKPPANILTNAGIAVLALLLLEGKVAIRA